MTNGTEDIRRLYVDACIYIYAFEGTSPDKRRLRNLFRSRRTGERHLLCTSELSLCECLVGALKRQDGAMERMYTDWSQSNHFHDVGPVDKDVLFIAARLRADNEGLKLPDAIHLATAMSFNCSHFLTRDNRLKAEYNLVDDRSGPRSWAFLGDWRGGYSMRVISPDTPSLAPLLEAPLP